MKWARGSAGVGPLTVGVHQEVYNGGVRTRIRVDGRGDPCADDDTGGLVMEVELMDPLLGVFIVLGVLVVLVAMLAFSGRA